MSDRFKISAPSYHTRCICRATSPCEVCYCIGTFPCGVKHGGPCRSTGEEAVRMTDTEFQPLDSAVVPRFAEPACFMRSPHVPLEGAEGLDIGLAGVPYDMGSTNRNRAGTSRDPRGAALASTWWDSAARRMRHASRGRKKPIRPCETARRLDLCPSGEDSAAEPSRVRADCLAQHHRKASRPTATNAPSRSCLSLKSCVLNARSGPVCRVIVRKRPSFRCGH
jgi:hypothetical protein